MMCLLINDRKTKEFLKKFGNTGFIEVFKRVDLGYSLVREKEIARAPYRGTLYPLHKQNYIEAKGFPDYRPASVWRQTREYHTRELHGGAIHVYLEYPPYREESIITGWAPLDKLLGVNKDGTQAAFPYIIVDDKDWERFK